MIEALKIKLLDGMHANADWECVLEIPGDYSLDELHQAILNAVGFENDHLFEFAIGHSYYSRSVLRISYYNEKITQETVDTILSQIKGKKLFYMFDYGDSWLFQISKSRKKRSDEDSSIFYPRVSLESGIKPEQYPDWDE